MDLLPAYREKEQDSSSIRATHEGAALRASIGCGAQVVAAAATKALEAPRGISLSGAPFPIVERGERYNHAVWDPKRQNQISPAKKPN
jgi:hypothetical protein